MTVMTVISTIMSTVMSTITSTVISTVISTITSTDVIGYVSGVLTSIAFLPQAWDVGRWHPHLSYWTRLSYLLYLVGVIGWVIYGTRMRSIPIVFFNSFSFVIVLNILIVVTTYQPKLQ